MTVELNPNEIAAKVVLDAFERSVGAVGRVVDDAYDSLSLKLKAGYRQYKKRAGENYGYVRTILHRDKQIPLRDLYVATVFTHDRSTLSDADLISIIAKPCRILIQGTAGGGKSVFLRLLNQVAATSSAKVLPIFIELKSLNSNPGKSIKDLAAEYLIANGLDYSEKSVRSLVDNGRILFILDGFDEINYELRERYAQQINDICKNHENASVVVSSRPDDMVSAVERLSIYRVKPFTREQAIELLEKLPYDETVRSKFISEINPAFFQRHKDFLSIPLLVTMMLMTYHQFAEIPSKVYLVYENAFATLFSWHDSSKDVFKRKSYTDLPMDEFKRFFSYFCFDSYTDQRFQFPEWDILDRINAAIEAEGISVDREDLLKDLLISVCLMQRDGLSITFVHRSFQEYFAAFYITRLDDTNARSALDSATKRVMADLVMPMVQAMAPALFERAWALPTVRALNKKLAGIDSSADPFRFFRVFFDTFTVEDKRMVLSYGSNIWAKRFMAISRSFASEHPHINVEDSNKGASDFVEAIKSDERYRAAVERETGQSISPDDIENVRFSFGLETTCNTLGKHLKISDWAVAERQFLHDLEVTLSERVKARGTSFKTALARRASSRAE